MTTSAIATEPPPLNVGVYGTTRAGKTRFLYELLAGWQRSYRLVESSPAAKVFLDEVEPDIRAYEHSRGTVKTLEGIQVLVQRGGDQPPWSLTFRDLRGEFLAHEVDSLAKPDAQASIPRQVRECNSFVFFFDPTSEDAPDQVEAHHARELRRAGRFIDYVLAERQNRYLPILFVLTRLDRWEEDPALRDRADAWAGRVNEMLRKAYRRALGGHFPRRLADGEATTLAISSVRGDEVEQVVDRLGELVVECDEFHRRDRKRLWGVMATLGGTLGLFALLAVAVFWFVRQPDVTPPPNNTKQPRTTVREWTPDEVRTQLTDLDRLLGSHPPGRTLPTADEARALNAPFRWLPLKLEFTRTEAGFPAGLRKEMAAALERLIGVVQAKLEPAVGEPLAARWRIAANYLEDVPEPAVFEGDPEGWSRALEQLRGDAWSLGRQQLVQQLADVLKRRDQVNSPPLDAVNEALSLLNHAEQDLKAVRIGGLKAQSALIGDVQTTATFLDVRKKGYTARFRLVSGRVLGANVSEVERSLTLFRPIDRRTLYVLETTRVDGREVAFRTRQPEYTVEFGLGGPVVLQLGIWSEAGDKPAFVPLKDFDLSAKGQAGPLRVIGLPLSVLGQSAVQKKIDWQGYELTLEWLDLPRAPALLEEAAARLVGGTP